MKTAKSSAKRKYLYLGSFIVLAALSYGAYKTYGPQPIDINEVYNKTAAPAVIIRGNDVWVKDGEPGLVSKDTPGAKWVAPGTYAGMPGDDNKGRTINGHFFAWGSYGTFVPPTAAERQAAADFTNAVRQAAGNTTPATGTNTNLGKGGFNNQAVGNTGAQQTATPTPVPAAPVGNIADLNRDGKINVLDYNLFVINYNRRGEQD